MRKRSFGKTGIEVSELGLGTWGLSGDAYGPVSEKTQDSVIERAKGLGITLFETADSYAGGEMERKLGLRLKDSPESIIVTKIGSDLEADPPRKRFDSEFIRTAFEKSQERIGRDTLDVVLLHNPSRQAIKRTGAIEVLQGLVEDKRLKAWGISAGRTETIWSALSSDLIPDVIQIAYNAFFSRDLEELEYDLEEHGIGLMARSVLAHGLLAGMWPPDKIFDEEDHRSERWTVDQLKRRQYQLQALSRLMNADVDTMRGVAVRYVLDNSRVNSAVLGPRDTRQLDQLVREAGRKPPYLESDDKNRFESRLNELGVYE